MKAGLITILSLLFLTVLRYIPLHYLNIESDLVNKSLSLSALGFAPVLMSFLFVELLALVVPFLKNLRNKGTKGRKKLNQIAFVFSFFIALIQAGYLSAYLYNSEFLLDFHIVSQNSQILFQFVTITTLVATMAVTILIAALITSKGLANGFCCLIILDLIFEVITNYRQVYNVANFQWKTQGANTVAYNHLGHIFLSIGLAIILWQIINKKWVTQAVVEDGTVLNLELPVFPQSIYFPLCAISMPTFIINIGTLLSINASWVETLGSTFTWDYFYIITGSTIVLSRLGFWLFSSPTRIETHGKVSIKNSHDIFKFGWFATILLVVGVGFANYPRNHAIISLFSIINFYSLIGLLCIVKDSLNQYRFNSAHRNSALLVEMDNTHRANVINAFLQAKGVPCFIQALNYRQLFFIFAPLIKMRVMVPSSDKKKSEKILKTVNLLEGYV